MKHRITCQCEHVFDTEQEELVDLDLDSDALGRLMDGTFMALRCPSCDAVLKPEFPLRLRWTSRGVDLEVIPEFDRGDLGSRKDGRGELVVGYAEAAERIAVYRDGLEPMAVETLKYYLQLKAEEADPQAEASVWFQGLVGDSLEFHVHGLRSDEVAVSRVPRCLYEKTLGEYRADPSAEPFASMRFGPYLSVQNLMRPEGMD